MTGAGRGIGRALAVGLAAEGADLVLVARSRDQLEDTAALVGTNARVIPADLGDLAQVAEVAAEAGPVDILINNAAVPWPAGPTATVDPAEFAYAVAVNVTAVAALTIHLLPGMLQRGWGRIVNLSSGAAQVPAFLNGGNAYTTTKSAVEGHSVNLAAELADTGVTVNIYRPGTVDTSMMTWVRDGGGRRMDPKVHEFFADVQDRGDLLTPDQSAGYLLARLAGDDTGQTWHAADGVIAELAEES
ncbi:SDR family NAD(P)-dependent oxidoreductase [Kutzneria kofuensis]|uniref:NAD(P)-dependent dehydrogenase (Short-subunit alcohol dehydrogenase family) n=1 Tax=Kutzneria kofuensis TaxID=103725 RepID=A0A7W9KS70_9PSEU|nr:SDR family oxidoreductase [Kutzneria kofuensis]MBB5897685.1 NAD(P)-dependent dehydrogenase (short-subunit alcohol dehydrogenase family) [Kutzneria kofuensis]